MCVIWYALSSSTILLLYSTLEWSFYCRLVLCLVLRLLFCSILKKRCLQEFCGMNGLSRCCAIVSWYVFSFVRLEWIYCVSEAHCGIIVVMHQFPPSSLWYFFYLLSRGCISWNINILFLWLSHNFNSRNDLIGNSIIGYIFLYITMSILTIADVLLSTSINFAISYEWKGDKNVPLI